MSFGRAAIARTVSIDIVCTGAIGGTTVARPISATTADGVGCCATVVLVAVLGWVCGATIGVSVISHRTPAKSR